MIQLFFRLLIMLWLRNQNKAKVCNEAFAFHQFLHELKSAVFIPAAREKDREWRLRQVQKCVRKMPRLSEQFVVALQNLENEVWQNSITRNDYHFLTIKRENVASLIQYLQNIAEDKHVLVLQGLLMSQPDSAKPFKLKRNRKA